MKKRKSKFNHFNQHLYGRRPLFYIGMVGGLISLIALLKPEWVGYVIVYLKR